MRTSRVRFEFVDFPQVLRRVAFLRGRSIISPKQEVEMQAVAREYALGDSIALAVARQAYFG